MTRLLIYVQHLLGTGHLVRALSLAEAFAAEGFTVFLVSGGFPLPRKELPRSVEFIQLPPLRALPGDFTALVDEHDRPIDDHWKAARRDELLRHATEIRPHAAIIETFPFGRRQLHFELLPLMENFAAMRPKPLLAASIRDVLQERTRARWQETADLVERYFDLVLVHGDPGLIP
ncbi:MAG: glycosyl transferase, partial [Pseudomonadota bacterium]|nr:glycosyl transferase [Pseudomonadota bacterium]